MRYVDWLDKLKLYDLPIHVAADAYWRKVIWLQLCKSNNNPIIPTYYFNETGNSLGLASTLLRTACTNEN